MVGRATSWQRSTENRLDDVMNSTPIRGILFDMDGVLCDSEPFIREASTLMLRERYGIRVTDADFNAYVGMGEDRFITGAAEQYGVTITLPDDKEHTYRLYLDLIRGRLRPLPGVLAFLRRCRSLHVKTAVATSANREKLEGNLREIPIHADAFDALVSAEDVRAAKPDPEIFVTAAARIGVDPASCLVVEDAVHGITAGLRAGCRCLGITSSFDVETLLGAGAHWTAPDLTAIPAAIPLRGKDTAE